LGRIGGMKTIAVAALLVLLLGLTARFLQLRILTNRELKKRGLKRIWGPSGRFGSPRVGYFMVGEFVCRDAVGNLYDVGVVGRGIFAPRLRISVEPQGNSSNT
jgi:hypothetical protein